MYAEAPPGTSSSTIITLFVFFILIKISLLMSNGISVWISIISTSIPNSFNSETESIIKFKVDPYDTIDISFPFFKTSISPNS